MKKSSALALEVLLEDGMIEVSGSSYKFKGDTVSVLPDVREPERGVVVIDSKRLPWMEVREAKPGDYMPTTKQGRIFCVVKLALGLDWKDRSYDKVMWKRSIRAVNHLLAAFRSEQECAEFVLAFGEQMRDAGIENWSIDAVVRSAYNSKGQREQMR